MKVKCQKLINPNTGKPEESSPWLTLDKEYVVLETYLGDDDRILMFRFQHDDNKSPALSHANLFEVTSDFIPSTWAVTSVPDRYFSMGPRSWQVDGFWMAYFDGVPWALKLYEEEVSKMIEEENNLPLV